MYVYCKAHKGTLIYLKYDLLRYSDGTFFYRVRGIHKAKNKERKTDYNFLQLEQENLKLDCPKMFKISNSYEVNNFHFKASKKRLQKLCSTF